jgi:hypothetical protein
LILIATAFLQKLSGNLGDDLYKRTVKPMIATDPNQNANPIQNPVVPGIPKLNEAVPIQDANVKP